MKDYNSETAKFLKQQKHVTVAVVDENNKPWVVPLGIQKLEDLVIEWDSHMKSRHSLAIDHNPHIAMTAFASKDTGGDEVGVYMEGIVETIEPIQGEFARYKARITGVWYNDSDHVKREINCAELAQQLT